MTEQPLRETDLYAPVKQLLEGQGYAVKGEIGDADVVATRDDDPPLIVELKLRFSLALFHQAIARQSMSDAVYIAVAHAKGPAFAKSLRRNLTLCRRLGLGMLTVKPPSRKRPATVVVHLDPAPYRPRPSLRRKSRLLREFAHRVGDPNEGGSARQTMMTAYRQDALRCLAVLATDGATKAAHVAQLAEVDRARRILSDDHYGWFERVATGIYDLTPKGRQALEEHADTLLALRQERKPD